MTHEEDTPLHRGAEHRGGTDHREVGWAGLDLVKLGGRVKSEPAQRLPWVLPVVLCQRACSHAPLPWRGGRWVVEVWPLITSSRRDHSPPQGLSRVVVFSVVERKKKRRNYLLFFSNLAGQQHSSAGRGASTLDMCLYNRSHVHQAIRHQHLLFNKML